MSNRSIRGPQGLGVASADASRPETRGRAQRQVGPEGVGGDREQHAASSWKQALAWTRANYPTASSRAWPQQPIPGLPGFTVRAWENGLIQVQRGDWISKYSIVLTGKLYEWHRFYRWDPQTQGVIPLTNPHLILEGEAVFFAEWLGRGFQPTIPPVRRRPSIKEREGTIKRIADEMEVEIPEQVLEDFAGLVTNLDYINQVVGAVQFFDILAGPLASGVGAGAGALLSVVGNTIALIQALDTGYHLHALEASAYAITHWAFELPPPAPPDMRARYELGHGGGDLDARLQRLDETWKQSVADADRALRDSANPARLAMMGHGVESGEAHVMSLALVRLGIQRKAGANTPARVLAWTWKTVTDSYRSWGESAVLKQIVGQQLPWPCPRVKR